MISVPVWSRLPFGCVRERVVLDLTSTAEYKQDSLGGNSKTIMIANVSPSSW